MGEKNKAKIHGIFISGPMTGLENYNFDKFNEVAARLIRAGYNVINPVKICKKFKQEEVIRSKEAFDAMVAEQQVAEREQCDAILLLDGWEMSLGVRLELQTAIELKFQIFLEKDLPWLCDDDKESEENQKVDSLHYESLRDKALDMAYTLRKIDRELSDAAQCEGDYPGGYPSEKLLPQLCKIMYASQQYHELPEMLTDAERARIKK